MGRWTALKTAKIYINSGLAMLTDIQVPRTLLTPFHNIFHNWNSKPPLEPVLMHKNSAGGRGKKRKAQKTSKGARGRIVVRYCVVFWIFKVIVCV